MPRLTVVPPAPAGTQPDDLDRDEAVDWLRRMMDVSRDLCDAIDAHLGPVHPPQRPHLMIVPDPADNHSQDQDVPTP